MGIDFLITSLIIIVSPAGIGIFQQRFCTSQIVILARRQHQVDRIAQGIDEGMDLGGQSPAGSPDRLRAVFFTAPALC